MGKDHILVAISIIAVMALIATTATIGEIIAIRKGIPSEHREAMCWIGAIGSLATFLFATYLFIIY